MTIEGRYGTRPDLLPGAMITLTSPGVWSGRPGVELLPLLDHLALEGQSIARFPRNPDATINWQEVPDSQVLRTAVTGTTDLAQDLPDATELIFLWSSLAVPSVSLTLAAAAVHLPAIVETFPEFWIYSPADRRLIETTFTGTVTVGSLPADLGLMELLRRLDDPVRLESPAGFNRKQAAISFGQLAEQLNSHFNTRCETDRDFEDASEFGRVAVPAAATVCGTQIVVQLSKFTPLSMIAAEAPGAFFGIQDARSAGKVDPTDVHKVEQTLISLGYVPMPEEVLQYPYDGPTDLGPFTPPGPTWWDRYFAYH
ncbi:hypothetical protein [Kribbella sp. DT2]|uniref:hypothetical protein n=1 Tax=Kribbella sp. DT2 TaxID=3393427 RepID=UPI003CF19AFC